MQRVTVIDRFYSAFQQRDWKTMQACYHPQVVFSDPVFNNLQGRKAGAMWHMLVEAGNDLKIEYENVVVNDKTGSCTWRAQYTFSRTGRKVNNVIHATFEVEGDLIKRHVDNFDLWRWAGMALGTPGVLFGWTPLMKGKIRNMAESRLRKFIQQHAEYSQ